MNLFHIHLYALVILSSVNGDLEVETNKVSVGNFPKL